MEYGEEFEESKESYEPALRRLDMWNYGKVNRNYTPEVAKKFKLQIAENMRKSRELSDLATREHISKYSRERILKVYTNYWAKAYHNAELYMDEECIEKFEKEGMSPLAIQEFAQPLIENFSRLRGFVGKVRKSINPRLTDPQIDQIFSDHFNGIDGFIKYSRETMALAPTYLKLFNPEMSEEELFLLNQKINLAIEVAPMFYRLIYVEKEGGILR